MPIAWIYPGQGSQTVGMGVDLVKLPTARKRLIEAKSILGWSLSDLTETNLKYTSYIQPALFLVEAILSDILKEHGCFPDAVAGHSLGEYSALYCADMIDFVTGLQLVQQRARLMETDCQVDGIMVAVIGFDRSKLWHLCETTQNVFVANDNSDGQVVLSGMSQAVEDVIDVLEPSRSVPLRVTGAFHSPFMNGAAKAFANILDETDFHLPQVPVYSNSTGAATQNPMTIKANLQQQMTTPVLWRKTMLNLLNDGIDEVWEIGPGDVLSKLAKYADRSLRRINIATHQDIQYVASCSNTDNKFDNFALKSR